MSSSWQDRDETEFLVNARDKELFRERVGAGLAGLLLGGLILIFLVWLAKVVL